MLGRAKLMVALAALALCGTSTGLATAAPGELDGSFGSGGKALVDLGGAEFGRAVALRPDGRIVIAGKRDANPDFDAIVAQLVEPQGTLDPSYGGGTGWSRLDFGGGDTGYGVALQPNGRIVVVGQSSVSATNSDGVVARLLDPQGTFDPSYGGGTGWSRLDFGGLDAGYGLALQPNGRIVVAGRSFVAPNGDGVVARLLDPQGTLDPSYGGGTGWSRLDFGGVDSANAVAIQGDGRFVVVGSSTIGGVRDAVVARLLEPQGTFDPSFGGGTGRTRIDFGGFDTGEAVALQPDGKIVIVGEGGGAGGNDDLAVARLMPNGTPDSSFAGGGRAFIEFGGGDSGAGVALQPDGKIVVAGTSYANGAGNFAVARLQPNGSLDTTFGTGGRTLVDFGGNDFGLGLALQSDGRIVVVGENGTAGGKSDIAVAQLQGDPRPGPTGPTGPTGPLGPLGPPTCAGKRATIVGTAGRDVLRGTGRADVIAALAGNDVVRGRGGGDLICGGLGKDRLFGERGKDRLLGGNGADRLFGGLGADRLLGGAGPDQLLGGNGADRLFGGLGADRLLGGAGADQLLGGAGTDRLIGGPGRNAQRQ